MELRYVLTIRVPETIDATTASDIEEDAQSHDLTQEAKVRRYLGGVISEAGVTVRDELPEGWDASIVAAA